MVIWKEDSTDGDRFELNADGVPNVALVEQRFHLRDVCFRKLPDMVITSQFVPSQQYLACGTSATGVRSVAASSTPGKNDSLSASRSKEVRPSPVRDPRAFFLANRRVYGDSKVEVHVCRVSVSVFVSVTVSVYVIALRPSPQRSWSSHTRLTCCAIDAIHVLLAGLEFTGFGVAVPGQVGKRVAGAVIPGPELSDGTARAASRARVSGGAGRVCAVPPQHRPDP